MALTPDWTTTLGSVKRIGGTMLINGSVVQNPNLWEGPSVRLRHTLSGEQIDRSAEIDEDTGEIFYELQPSDYTKKGYYEVKFGAVDPNGKQRYFPEGRDKILFVDD